MLMAKDAPQPGTTENNVDDDKENACDAPAEADSKDMLSDSPKIVDGATA